MKTFSRVQFLCFVVSVLLFTACSSDDGDSEPPVSNSGIPFNVALFSRDNGNGFFLTNFERGNEDPSMTLNLTSALQIEQNSYVRNNQFERFMTYNLNQNPQKLKLLNPANLDIVTLDFNYENDEDCYHYEATQNRYVRFCATAAGESGWDVFIHDFNDNLIKTLRLPYRSQRNLDLFVKGNTLFMINAQGYEEETKMDVINLNNGEFYMQDFLLDGLQNISVNDSRMILVGSQGKYKMVDYRSGAIIKSRESSKLLGWSPLNDAPFNDDIMMSISNNPNATFTALSIYNFETDSHLPLDDTDLMQQLPVDRFNLTYVKGAIHLPSKTFVVALSYIDPQTNVRVGRLAYISDSGKLLYLSDNLEQIPYALKLF